MAIEKQLVDSLALAEYDEYVKRALEGKANKKDLEGIPSAEEYLTFEQTVSRSLTDMSERMNIFDESKADKSDLEALQTAIDGKADQADLDAKADKSDLEGLENAIGSKASQTQLESLEVQVLELEKAVEDKADKTDLDAKANQTDLEALKSVVNGKADKTELDLKADKTDLDAKADKTDLDAKADKTDLDAKASIMQLEEVERQVLTLETTISQNSTDVNERINNLDKSKADVADLLALDSMKADKTDLDLKADKSDLEGLENAIGSKASQTQLESLEVQVLTLETTISQSSADVNERINNLDESKADKADLLGLDSVKADKSDLTALEERVTSLEESGGGSGSSDNLEGTSWIFNSSPDISTEFSYNIEFEYEDDGELYTRTSMSVQYLDAARANALYFGGEPVFVDGYSWVTMDGIPVTFKITGGSDVNNPELKAYLEANATQNTVEYATKEDLESLRSTMGMMGNSLQEQIDNISNNLPSGSSSLWKMLSRQSFSSASGGLADLYNYMQTYNEVMVVVRMQTTQSTYIALSSSTEYSLTNKIVAFAPSTGTQYFKVLISKTDEGNYAVSMENFFGWSTSSGYRYLKYWPLSSSNPGTTSISFVIHGRM